MAISRKPPVGYTPTFINVTLTSADTEYSQLLPTGTVKVSVQLRSNDAAFRIAYVTGKVATPTEPYYTIQSGNEYYEDQMDLTGLTIYLACGSAGKIAEIIAWT